MARGTNVELNPNAKTPPKPSTGYASDLASIPALNTHGPGKPTFPGEPNVSTDRVDLGQDGEKGGWFHG